MLMRGWLWLIRMPSENGKSGKREVAVSVAIWTMVMLCWAWPALTSDQKAEIVMWMLSLSAILLMAAFGFDALLRQAGLRFGPGGVEGEVRGGVKPAPPPSTLFNETTGERKPQEPHRPAPRAPIG